MYSKVIKRGKKKYTYYYHNLKKEGRVKNICLGSSRKEALAEIEYNNQKPYIQLDMYTYTIRGDNNFTEG